MPAKTPAERKAAQRQRELDRFLALMTEIDTLKKSFLTKDDLRRILARGLPADLQEKLEKLTR